MKEIAEAEKAKKEQKSVDEIMEKVLDFIKENKSNMAAIKPIVTKCKEAGVKTIIAKCSNEMHKKILMRVGADKVVFPEKRTTKQGFFAQPQVVYPAPLCCPGKFIDFPRHLRYDSMEDRRR